LREQKLQTVLTHLELLGIENRVREHKGGARRTNRR
jgi:hypothetical protein